MTSLLIHELHSPLRVDADGVVRVGQTRVTLETVLGAFLAGQSAEEIADCFPVLHLDEVYATIAYYLQNRPEVDTYLRASEAEAAEVRRRIAAITNPPNLRERLLARMAARGKAG